MRNFRQGVALLLFSFILSGCAEQDQDGSVEGSRQESSTAQEATLAPEASTFASENALLTSDASDEASAEISEGNSNELTPDNIPEWSKAYAEYLRTGSEYISYDEAGNDLSYTLIYLDNDDVPELFINTGIEASGEIVVTYYDGEVIENHLYRLGSQYIEKSGFVYTDTGHMDYYPVTIMKLENGTFTEIASGLKYLSEENSKKMSQDENYPYTLSYEWEDEPVTEEEFNANVAEYYDVDKGKYPDNYYTYDEFLYLLENGKWYSADHKYELVVQDCSWSEAQKICLEKGGYLATVTCTEEAEVISDLISKERYTDNAFFVGYRSSEWVGDTFCSSRWINQDGSYMEVMPSIYDFWDYNSPGYDYETSEWPYDYREVGLAKFYEDEGMIYIFEAPDNLLEVSPEYAGKVGFVCEYD